MSKRFVATSKRSDERNRVYQHMLSLLPPDICEKCRRDRVYECYLAYMCSGDATYRMLQCESCRRYAARLQDQIDDLKQVRVALKKELANHFLYAPGGPGFLEAMASFNTHNR